MRKKEKGEIEGEWEIERDRDWFTEGFLASQLLMVIDTKRQRENRERGSVLNRVRVCERGKETVLDRERKNSRRENERDVERAWKIER